MRNILLFAVVFCGLVAAQEVKMSVTPAVGADKFTETNAFVIGKDAKTRTCPADYNVYVRMDGKKPEDKNLYYVMPKQVLLPQGSMNYTIVCIKMGN